MIVSRAYAVKLHCLLIGRQLVRPDCWACMVCLNALYLPTGGLELLTISTLRNTSFYCWCMKFFARNAFRQLIVGCLQSVPACSSLLHLGCFSCWASLFACLLAAVLTHEIMAFDAAGVLTVNWAGLSGDRRGCSNHVNVLKVMRDCMAAGTRCIQPVAAGAFEQAVRDVWYMCVLPCVGVCE